MADIAAPVGVKRRGTELALIGFGLVLTMVAFTSASAAYSDKLPSGLVSDGLGFIALAGVAHLAVRRFAPYADPVLLPAAVVLNGLGLVLIHRLDLGAASNAKAAGTSAGTAAAPLQLVWTIIGVALFVGVLVVVRDHRRLQSLTYTAMAAGLGLLVLPALLPASHSTVNGARIWIRFGGFSFQPGEIAKLALEVFFAGYLVSKRDVLALAGRKVIGITLPRGRDLGPVLVAWAASLLVLTRESDLGSSLLFFGIFVVMLYVATERRSWLLIGLALFAVGAFAANHFIGHVHERVEIWLHPLNPATITNTSYQLAQGLFGQATGGIFGTGLGQGRPDIVPYANTDFIASTIAEELGLAGLMAVLVIYLLIVMRGIRAALGTRDDFGKLLGAGLAFGLALQVFVQVGGVTRLIPLTGLTLPFLSYGGSSLVSNWMVVALLIRISDAARRPAPDRPAAPDEHATVAIRL
ncbi:MAG TPA: FtsW/RodA/SpoVE family cell cycle protein [Mycobacteriales bacterium]|nr:FtsW/RodA/SpoVE family cell cycle protein [Mycobacteriales bacterium]HWA66385.1 FtsW/RodA/SpoVE family cell cycle protein [Mycobacteriales bacterium]